MKLRSVLLGSLVVGISICMLGSARAGNNAGGTVKLTWDRGGYVTTFYRPSTDPFLLYLLVEGAPDIKELAVSIRWMPFDPLQVCYGAIPGSSDQTCGWAAPIPAIGGFAGDSTYTWTIFFPPTATTKNCVAFWFSAETCDSFPPARFLLASVQVMDSNGAIDNLTNVGDAKLLGGRKPPPNPIHFGTPSPPNTEAITISSTPNPAESYADIQLSLPSDGVVAVVIYDVGGRLVRKLSAGWIDRGARTYTWDLTDSDGRQVTSGIYFARVFSSMGTKMVRLVVAK